MNLNEYFSYLKSLTQQLKTKTITSLKTISKQVRPKKLKAKTYTHKSKRRI